MFRKLVSNLSFSPALITQVGFYAQRLRKEEITRRLTIIFVVLALVVQSLAVFSPPDSANAASEQDLIRGGVQDINDFLARYDTNSEDIKDIYTALGVTRDEITATHRGTFNSKSNIYSVNRFSQYGPEQGETRFSYKRSAGGEGVRYISPLSLADTSMTRQQSGTTYDAYIGQSAKIGWFAIMKANASLATSGYPTTVTPDGATTTLSVVKNISSVNVSQSAPASEVTAKPFDKISYTLSAQNNNKKAVQLPLSINLSDILEYTTLIDDGGGSFDPSTKTLSWPSASISPGTTEQRTFAVQLTATIPATATGQSNGNSYDCILSTTYGSSDKINVECPLAKGVESILSDLPPAGMLVNIIFALLLVIAAVYFHARTHQLKKEIRMIRHSINTGTI